MSENDGKIHTVYMRDPLKIKSQNLPYKKTDLYGEISRGLPGPCREMVLVERSLLDRCLGADLVVGRPLSRPRSVDRFVDHARVDREQVGRPVRAVYKPQFIG